MTETSLAAAPAPAFKLAKTLGILAITASAVSAEYGAGINYVSVQSLSVYPDVHGLVPLAMFVCGIAMLPKAYLFAVFSRVMPRAGSKHVWLARSLGMPAGFLITFIYWATGPAGLGVLGYAFGTFLGQAMLPISPALGHFLLSHDRASDLRAGGDLDHLRGQRRRRPPLRHLRHGPAVRHRRSGAVHHRLRLFRPRPQPSSPPRATRRRPRLRRPPAPPADSLFHFISVCAPVRLRLCRARRRAGAGRRGAHAEKKGTDRHLLGLVGRAVLFTVVAAALFHAAPWWAVVRTDQGRQEQLCDGAGTDRPGRAEMADRRAEPRGRADRRQDAGAGADGISRFCFAQAQDHMLPAVFAEVSRRKVPLAALLLVAVLGSLFLRAVGVFRLGDGRRGALAGGARHVAGAGGRRTQPALAQAGARHRMGQGDQAAEARRAGGDRVDHPRGAADRLARRAAEDAADLPADVPGRGGAGDRGGDPRGRERQGEEPRRELPLDRRDPAGRIEAFVIARETPGGSTPGSPPLTGTVSSLQSWVKSGSGGYQSKIVLD